MAKKKNSRKKGFLLLHTKKGRLLLGLSILALLVLLAVLIILNSQKEKHPAPANESHSEAERQAPPAFVPTTGTRGQGFSVCLDAGHGGKDPGTSGGGYTEAEDTLAMTLLIAQCLEAQGCRVVLTRSEDVFLSLEERVDLANAEGVNALVSIHRNTVDDASVGGVEAWIHSAYPSNAAILSEDILSAIGNTGTMSVSRGVRSGTSADPSDNYWINRASSMASCILELGFMSNEADNRAYHDQMGVIAQAVADGILDAVSDPQFQ